MGRQNIDPSNGREAEFAMKPVRYVGDEIDRMLTTSQTDGDGAQVSSGALLRVVVQISPKSISVSEYMPCSIERYYSCDLGYALADKEKGHRTEDLWRGLGT